MRKATGVLVSTALLVFAATARADPDTLMACKAIRVRESIPAPHPPMSHGVTRFRCTGTFPLPSAGAAPTTGVVSTITVRDVAQDPPPSPYPLSAWRGIGNPPGSKGYEWKVPNDFCRRVLVTPTLVKGVCDLDLARFGAFGTTLPFVGDLAIRLHLVGTSDTKDYCGRFGGITQTNNEKTFRARNAPAPVACSPSGAFTTAGDDELL